MVNNGAHVGYDPDHSLRFSLLLAVTPVTNQESGKPVYIMSDGTKIRKNDTLFMEEGMQNIEMHQGIFIDILPLDKIPNNPSQLISFRFISHVLRSAC